MFTGLVQAVGRVQRRATGLLVQGCSPLAPLAEGDSVAVDGVCLTVAEMIAPGQAHPGPRGGVYALLARPGRRIHRSWAQDRPGQDRCRYTWRPPKRRPCFAFPAPMVRGHGGLGNVTPHVGY